GSLRVAQGRLGAADPQWLRVSRLGGNPQEHPVRVDSSVAAHAPGVLGCLPFSGHARKAQSISGEACRPHLPVLLATWLSLGTDLLSHRLYRGRYGWIRSLAARRTYPV